MAQEPAPRIHRRRSNVSGGTRDGIVAAAAEIFGQRGFGASSVDEVAQQAGVTKATVYYHFSSKEELYAAVRVALLEQSTAQASESVQSYSDPLSALVHLVELTISLTLDRSRKYMFFHEIVPISNEVRSAIGRAQRDYAVLLEQAVESGQKAGVIRPGSPRIIVSLLLGAIARTTNWYNDAGEMKPDAFSDLLCSMLLTGVVVGEGRKALEKRKR
ncbi:MAG: TetR/AcrR family transcriptional regulator [Dehalococcoidia bacterium]